MVCALVWPSTPARAEKSDATILLTTTLYGTLAGTALGLVTYPFTQTHQSILIGAGVGLVLGIIVGIYHVNHREDPNNPLRGELRLAPKEALTYAAAAAAAGPELTPPALILAQEPTFARARERARLDSGVHLMVAYPVFRF